MKISRENYEQYFIDYLDGNLSDQEIIMLENFLLLNPDYRNELEGMEKIILTPDENPYPGKDSLRQVDLSLPVNPNNFNDFCVALVEGDLTENLNRNFQDYLEIHPDKLNEYLIFNQVHLVPDKSIIFPFNDEMKKSVIFLSRKILYSVISIAATLVLIFIIVRQTVEPGRQYDNKPTADLNIKTDIPVINQQITNLVKEKNSVDKKQIPVNKKPGFQQIARFPIKNENNEEITLKDKMEKNPDETNKALLANYNSSLEINIPILIETDIDIPKTIYDIKPKEPNVNNTDGEYLSLAEFTRKELNEKIMDRKEDNLSRPSLFDIAGAGIKGINLLTGSKMKLEKKINAKGEPNILAFESKLFSFSTNVSPKE